MIMHHSNAKLTLTFDNGPDPTVTPFVLDTLNTRGLSAIFFPVGERLEHPDGQALMQRAANEGHQIGNHTYSHPRPFGALSGEQAIQEIERTDALLGSLCEPSWMFRPSAGGGVQRPGVLNRPIVDYLIATKHTLVLWNLLCEDWSCADGSWVEKAIAGTALQDHSLLVLHDIASGAMDHLPDFLDQILEIGIEITTDLPNAEVPIRRGELVGSVDHLL